MGDHSARQAGVGRTKGSAGRRRLAGAGAGLEAQGPEGVWGLGRPDQAMAIVDFSTYFPYFSTSGLDKARKGVILKEEGIKE